MRKVVKAACVAAVVLIVGVFLVQAIQKGEDEKRLNLCSNNLKQLGLGLHNFLQSHDNLPGGVLPNEKLPTEQRLSWIMGCMPFVLCMHCYGMPTDYDLTQSWEAKPNRTLASTTVYVLHCPGSPDQSGPGDTSVTLPTDLTGNPKLYPSAYVGIAGVGRDAALLPRSDPKAGVFGYERTTRLEDITDGTGSTMMVVETSDLQGAWTAGGAATVRGLDPARVPYIGRGHQFGGNHRGGTLVLLADGSVRFVRETVHPSVFEGLATIAGGEQIGQGWGE
jgi:hypothetical protein